MVGAFLRRPRCSCLVGLTEELPRNCRRPLACSASTLAPPATTPPWWSTTLAGFAPAAVPVPRSRPHRAGGGRAGRRRGGHPPGRGDRADRPGVAAGRGVLRPPRPHRAAGHRGPCAADLRRFLARHAKGNAIDAETLARLPLLAPAGLTPVGFGSAARASLDRRVRAVARLTAEVGRRKTRIRALAQALVPTTPTALSDDGPNQTDLAVLERDADPRALLDRRPGPADPAGRHGQPRPARRRQDPGAAHRRRGGGRAVGRRRRRRPGRPGRRGRQRGPPGPRRRGRTRRPRARPRRGLRPRRPGRAGRQPTRPGPGRRRPAGRCDGPTRAVPQRQRVQGLHRADAPSRPDRAGRPQAPAHDQGRPARAAQPAGPVRRHRPQARPAAGRGRPRPDDPAWRHPPQGPVRGRRPARRAGLAGLRPRRTLRRLRPRRTTGHCCAGQAAHRRALHRARRGPPPALEHQDGEGPHAALKAQGRSQREAGREATFPTPARPARAASSTRPP